MDYNSGKEGMAVKVATLSKWGNSSAVRIPNQLLKQLQLEEGAELQILVTEENEILLRPLLKSQSDTTEELRAHLSKLLSKIDPDSKRHDEIDMGIEGDELL